LKSVEESFFIFTSINMMQHIMANVIAHIAYQEK